MVKPFFMPKKAATRKSDMFPGGNTMTNNKIFKISLTGESEEKKSVAFREKMKNIFDLKVKDTSKVLPYEAELDSLRVVGRGAYFLVEKVGKEFLNDLLASEVTSAYVGEFGHTVMDVFDNLPLFSRITIEGEFEGYGEIGKYKVSFLKIANETKDLGEAFVSLMDYEEKYSFL